MHVKITLMRRAVLYVAAAVAFVIAIYFSSLSTRNNPWERNRERRFRDFCIALTLGTCAYGLFRWGQSIEDR